MDYVCTMGSAHHCCCGAKKAEPDVRCIKLGGFYYLWEAFQRQIFSQYIILISASLYPLPAVV